MAYNGMGSNREIKAVSCDQKIIENKLNGRNYLDCNTIVQVYHNSIDKGEYLSILIVVSLLILSKKIQIEIQRNLN